MTKIEALIERMDAHDDNAKIIAAEMAALGLDDKAVKKIRRAKADAAAAKKTLDALMAGGLAPPESEPAKDETATDE